MKPSEKSPFRSWAHMSDQTKGLTRHKQPFERPHSSVYISKSVHNECTKTEHSGELERVMPRQLVISPTMKTPAEIAKVILEPKPPR